MLQDAVILKTLGQSHKHDTPQSLDNNSDLVNRVVFIDSTWSQCQKIITVSMKSINTVEGLSVVIKESKVMLLLCSELHTISLFCQILLLFPLSRTRS